MDITTAHRLYEVLVGRDLTFLYSDVFADDHTAAIMGIGHEVLDPRADRTLRSRLSFVLVEAFQNIIRHRTEGTGRSMLLVQRGGDGCVVSAINPVTVEEGQALEQRLDSIGGLDLAQLKALFLQRLQNTSTSSRGGAGLGLIEMARRSGRALQHQIWPGDDGRQLFALHVRLGEDSPGVQADTVRWIHEMVVEMNLRVLMHGVGGPGMQQALLDLTASVSDKRRVERAQRIFLAVLEFVRRHEYANPMLVWTGRPDGHLLTIGLNQPAHAATSLKGQVARVQEMDDQMLKQQYRDRLLGRITGQEEVDLGLLDLVRHARAPIGFEQTAWKGEMLSLLNVPV